MREIPTGETKPNPNIINWKEWRSKESETLSLNSWLLQSQIKNNNLSQEAIIKIWKRAIKINVEPKKDTANYFYGIPQAVEKQAAKEVLELLWGNRTFVCFVAVQQQIAEADSLPLDWLLELIDRPQWEQSIPKL
jgi:hypothetical protein